MKQLTIDARLRALYPSVRLGCVRYRAEVGEGNPRLWELMERETIPAVRARLEGTPLPQFDNIRESRAAYKAFGKDPKRYRVSSEALIHRLKQGKDLYHVNTVVDANNLISIETGFSAGSYDLARLGERLELVLAAEGERYKGIGKEEVNIGCLPVLRDEAGFFGSPTSDSERAMITPASSDILTVLYCFTPGDYLAEALERAKERLREFAGAVEPRSWIVE